LSLPCLTQLLKFNNEILKILEDGDNADIMYLDLSKAFDKVDVGLLAHRLKSMGISGNIGRWLIEFLTNRTQQVLVNGKLGPISHVKSGVPRYNTRSDSIFNYHRIFG